MNLSFNGLNHGIYFISSISWVCNQNDLLNISGQNAKRNVDFNRNEPNRIAIMIVIMAYAIHINCGLLVRYGETRNTCQMSSGHLSPFLCCCWCFFFRARNVITFYRKYLHCSVVFTGHTESNGVVNIWLE